jgi:hypothetical protein
VLHEQRIQQEQRSHYGAIGGEQIEAVILDPGEEKGDT